MRWFYLFSIVVLCGFTGTLHGQTKATTQSSGSTMFFGNQYDDDSRVHDALGIGPRAGYYKSIDAEEGSYYLGVQMRIRPGSFVGLEGAVDYRGKELFDLGIQDTIPLSAEVRYIPITGSVMLLLPFIPNFAVYGIAGAGVYFTRIDYPAELNNLPPGGGRLEDRNESDFGYHFGAGIEIPFNRNVSISGDYRYLFLDTEFERQGDIELDPKNSDGSVITASLMFYF